MNWALPCVPIASLIEVGLANRDQLLMIKPPYAGTLLIVDDREDIRRAMERYFSLYFEKVFVAATPVQAEQILRAHTPTFILCDYWLGDEFLPSTEYIPGWRN